MRKGVLIICSVLLMLAIVLPSCKEGCTDTKALNFDHKAKSDNGMCLYCDTGSFHSTVTTRVQDFDSSFHNFDAADFVFSQNGLSQKGNGCRSIGIMPNQGCNIDLVIRNVTGKHMTGNYSITFSNSEGVSAWTAFNQLNTINPNDSAVFTQFITGQCDTLEKGFFNVQLSNMTYY